MKLYNVKDVKGLFDAVNDCEGSIEMVLPSQNINLNNNQELSEILSEIAPEEGFREIEIKAETKEDVYKLLRFAMRGEDRTGLTDGAARRSLRRTA